ncbi:MAG: hypothetical protein DLM71_06795 [Chloroflexi bacterium]|nr:MAG: hypothetical protein DLM71_06795 [Chloroflexota bacterium]
MSIRVGRLAIALPILGWLLFGWVTWFAVTSGWRETTGGVRLVDWHVYFAGARDLANRDLYRHALALDGLVLSSPVFNLPPLAAAWALPLLPMPIDLGGQVWQLIAAGCVALAVVASLRMFEIPTRVLWAGLVLGPLSLTLLYLEGLHLGTNNYLVLALVAGVAWAYLAGHDRTAGLLLALAVGTKLWPIVIAVPAFRDRRWRTLGWLGIGLAIQGIAVLVWLGPDFPGDFLAALAVQIPPTGLLFGPTADPVLREAWNRGLGVILAAVLLILPVRGRAGLGLAIIAGLAPIANLWLTYGLTILLAVSLVGAGLLRRSWPLRRAAGIGQD